MSSRTICFSAFSNGTKPLQWIISNHGQHIISTTVLLNHILTSKPITVMKLFPAFLNYKISWLFLYTHFLRPPTTFDFSFLIFTYLLKSTFIPYLSYFFYDPSLNFFFFLCPFAGLLHFPPFHFDLRKQCVFVFC